MIGVNIIMAKKTEPSSFFLSFVGEFVQIITSMQFTGAPGMRGASEDATLPLIVEGYVLDSDDDYTYLSPDGVEIKQAVRNDMIVYIQIIEAVDEATEILDTLPNNIKKRDMN
jgi:hypothetical protein